MITIKTGYEYEPILHPTTPQEGKRLTRSGKREPLDIPTMTTDFVKEHGFPCPTGYIFKDENSNVINATKIVLEKKKKEYPKTINECRYILQDASGDEVGWYAIDGWQFDLLEKMQMLLICRDAYWSLAGDWKPDYDSGVDKFGIICYNGVISKTGAMSHWERHSNKILDFPTIEMRDAFYENFKELINECKELL